MFGGIGRLALCHKMIADKRNRITCACNSFENRFRFGHGCGRRKKNIFVPRRRRQERQRVRRTHSRVSRVIHYGLSRRVSGTYFTRICIARTKRT